MVKLPGILDGTPASPKSLNFARPVLPPLEEIEQDIRQMLGSGVLTNQGPYAERLEQALAYYFNLPNIVVVGNATVGLMLALQSMEIGGGEVITPSFTFAATSDAIVWAGLEPVFADIDPNTLCLDPLAVEKLIGPQTGAIMPVHPFGGFCEVESFKALAQKYNLKLIYDSAQAVAIYYKEQPAGIFGDAEVFSMHATKVLPAGEGGFISTLHADLAERIRSTRNFGLNNRNYLPGLNGKITEFAARLGLAALETLSQHLTRRAHIYQYLFESLKDLPGLLWQQVSPNVQSNYQNLIVRIEANEFGLSADELAVALRYDNITTRRYFSPCLHQMPVFSKYRRGPLLHSELVTTQSISLPLYSDMTEIEAEIIANAIHLAHEYAKPIKEKVQLQVGQLVYS